MRLKKERKYSGLCQKAIVWSFGIILFQINLCAQEIPFDKVIKVESLVDYLNDDVKAKLGQQGEITPARLASYMREKFSERFFYDYQTVEDRVALYNDIYSSQKEHKKRALDHMHKYADSTQWVLPFNYLNGDEVNAYALRHLARQHKMVDVALLYFNEGKDPKYIKYFENQIRSLNQALAVGQYERIEEGNGVFEVFRAGFRVMNWLWIHNLFLGEPEYSDEDQLQTIATLLQHGAHLYNRNGKFRKGNHQTRGMSSLAMLGILLRDFKGTDLWLSGAMTRLEEHLQKEVNEDGFQFERTVHYHMSDIGNYFYPYQLAKISKIPIGAKWEKKLKSLFTSLAKIAYPDRTAPVLQDDTEIPWAEKNDISGAMTLGYLLFEDDRLGYFATDKVSGSMYWFLQKRQLDLLADIDTKKPSHGSLAFPDTHYYVMREGWDKDDKVMIISAGVDKDKPDHQHGDVLGVQAMANQHVVLPNYQVRYPLKDLQLFKNSMVKNVALVDDELQGKRWTSNKGGSGFGKFKELPSPTTIAWKTNDDFDLYIGSHDGFDNVGVAYTRQVVFVKGDFWIVKDNFQSDTPHAYKQVWQGHYTMEEGPNLLRTTFDDAVGCDIVQLRGADKVLKDGARGKQWTVISKENESNFSFVTAIYPFQGHNNRVDETKKSLKLDDWEINHQKWELVGASPISIAKENEAYFFGVSQVSFENWAIQSEKATDLFVKQKDGKVMVTLIGDAPVSLDVFRAKNKKMIKKRKKWGDQVQPGEQKSLQLK